MLRVAFTVLLLLPLSALPLRAQLVRGEVLQAESGVPIAGAMVVLLDAGGTVAARALTDDMGRFAVEVRGEGAHRARVDRIGYESLTTEPFDVPAGGAGDRKSKRHFRRLVRARAASPRCDRPPDATGRIVEGGRLIVPIPAERMLRQASRRNAAAIRAGRVDLRLGSVERLPPFDAPFDKVLSVNSLMFWPRPDLVLEQLRRWLRVGGRIAVAHQPRGPGASDATVATRGEAIAEALGRAGYSDVRIETLKLKPAVVCAIGVNGGGSE